MFTQWKKLRSSVIALATSLSVVLLSSPMVGQVFAQLGDGTQLIDLPPVYRRDRNLVRAVAITQESAAAPQEHLSAPILIQPLEESVSGVRRSD
jgi:energy-coupling factor transporter transmembrane protein EcfT